MASTAERDAAVAAAAASNGFVLRPRQLFNAPSPLSNKKLAVNGKLRRLQRWQLIQAVTKKNKSDFYTNRADEKDRI